MTYDSDIPSHTKTLIDEYSNAFLYKLDSPSLSPDLRETLKTFSDKMFTRLITEDFSDQKEMKRRVVSWIQDECKHFTSHKEVLILMSRQLPDVRQEILSIFQAKLQSGTKPLNLALPERYHYFLDQLFVHLTELMNQQAAEEDRVLRKRILELSAPIVPVTDDIAVVPLIGTIDYERGEHFFQTVIPGLCDAGIQCVILDFSGILTIDQEVERYLFNASKTLQILGLNVFITGIRPEQARLVVQAGIDLRAIRAYADVQHALEAWNQVKG